MSEPLAIAAAVGFSVATAFLAASRRRALAASVARGRLVNIAGRAPYERPVDVMRERRLSAVPALDRLLRALRVGDRVAAQLEHARVPMRVGEYLGLRIFCGGILGVLGALVAPLVGGGAILVFLPAAGMALGLALPPLYVARRAARRATSIEHQLVEFCDLMASMLESGFGYLQALATTSVQLGGPLAEELRSLLDVVRIGGDVDDALETLSRRRGSADFEMISTAIQIQRRTGGDLGEVLRTVATLVRERHELHSEIAALTARERLSASFLVAFPLLLAAALGALMPHTYGLLLTSTAGRLMLSAAIVMDAVGFFFIRRALRMDV